MDVARPEKQHIPKGQNSLGVLQPNRVDKGGKQNRPRGIADVDERQRAALPRHEGNVELDRIVEKALAKSPDERYQHVDELLVDLRALRGRPEGTSVTTTQVGAGLPARAPSDLVPKRQLHLAWGLLAGVSLLFVLTSILYFRDAGSDALQTSLRRFALPEATPVGTGEDVASGALTSPVAISPNGNHIAYASPNPARGLWVQDLDQHTPRALEGTEGAVSPFWSPDSESIGYATTRALFKIPAEGGRPTRLCELLNTHFHGGSWSPDGDVIVFSSGEVHSLYEVSARGGDPELIVSADGIDGARMRDLVLWPHFLPAGAGARVLAFSFGNYAEPTLVARDLQTGRTEVLGPGAFPFYSSTGHILFQPSAFTSELWALPFSLDTLQSAGEAFPVSLDSESPTIALDGTMAYRAVYQAPDQQLYWYSREGERVEKAGEPFSQFGQPALSPDGGRVAANSSQGGRQDLWVFDLALGVETRLTDDPGQQTRPIWAPSGEEVLFTSNQAGSNDIYLRKSDGTGDPQILLNSPLLEDATDWSRDDKYILYQVAVDETAWDIWYLERDEADRWEPHRYLETRFSEQEAKLSPDGRYVAYVSDESGQLEVYVRPFPAGGRKVTVSRGGGVQPRWSRDGRELYYGRAEPDGAQVLFAASVSTESGFMVNSEERLFAHAGLAGFVAPEYDVSAVLFDTC